MNPRWIARGLVVGLHLGLLSALWWHRPPSFGEHSDRRLTTVRLIPLPPRTPTPAPPPADRPAAPPQPRDRAAAPPPVLTTAPEPATEAPVATAPAPVVPPAAEPPRTTLRLTLPPGYAASSAAARNPALSDPRSNTPRLTLEDRIADATGGASTWVEEQTSENRAQSVGAQGEYRTVMRRGDTCVEVFRSRISDTDPFNGNVAPRAGKMLGKPYKCK